MDHEPDQMERAGGRGAKAPERQCALTRRHGAPGDLIRFVAGPGGLIVPDLAGKLPGRGLWLTATRLTVIDAIRHKTFARSLKREVVVPPDLADQVGELMLRRVLERLSLANKAGAVVAGFSKVDAALEKGRIFLLIHASDGAPDGIRKLDQKFAHLLRETGVGEDQVGRRSIRFLTCEELSLALGRPNVVHAGVAQGGAGRNLLAEAERLLRYRLGEAAGAAA